MNSYFKIIFIIILLFLFYILYINNIYLSYKVYNNKNFNDYDKTMLKITSIIQSIIFALTLLIITIALLYHKKTYEYLKNNKYNYNMTYELINILLIMLYYGHSVYINYNNFNNKYNFDDLKDEKNKNLRYHLYLSIPLLLLLVIPVIYKSYKLSITKI